MQLRFRHVGPPSRPPVLTRASADFYCLYNDTGTGTGNLSLVSVSSLVVQPLSLVGATCPDWCNMHGPPTMPHSLQRCG